MMPVRKAEVAFVLVTMFCGSSLFGGEQEQAERPDEPQVVVKNGRYGFIDGKGNFLIPPNYLWSDGFVNGLADTFVCGRMVKIDTSGNIHPMRRAGKGDLVPWKQHKRVGFVDSNGEFRIPASFDDARSFSDGMAAVKIGDKWGFIDVSGRQVIPPQYDDAYFFEDGSANVEINGEEAIIDRKGAVIYKGSNFLANSEDGRIPVLRGEKYGFIDRQGMTAIPFIYDAVFGFSEGLAPVKKGDKWGYIDINGQTVIPFEFDRAENFTKGLAEAKIGEDSGFIRKSGDFVFHLKFSGSSGFGFGNLARFWTDDDKFGYVDMNGNVVWGPTDEMPDHYQILGFSENDEKASCEGIPENIRKQVLSLPEEE